MVISAKNPEFSRSRMTKRTFPLKPSHEIELPRQILLDSEVVGISRFSRRGVSDDTWHGEEMPHGTSNRVTLGIKRNELQLAMCGKESHGSQ